MTPSEAFAAVNTRRTIAFASFLAVAVAVAGCEREHPTHVYPRGGVISGIVSDGAAIERGFDVVAKLVGNPEMVTSVTSRVGLDGRFELTVPNGKYHVYVQPGFGVSALYYNAAGPVFYDFEADTVLVVGDQHTLEFTCGRVAVNVDLPASLDGVSMYCGVAPVDTPSASWGYSDYVSNGLHILLRFVPPGSYRIKIGDGGFDRVYLPPTFDPTDADVIEVVAGQELAYASAIDALTTLGGSVTGSWQTFGEVLPRIDAFSDHVILDQVVVAADGSFAFTFLAGVSLRLRIQIGSLPQWIGGANFDLATVFDLETGDAVTGITHVESGLECVLTGALDGSGVYVTVYDDQRGHQGTVSSEGDTLRISNLRPGQVYLRISPRSATSIWLPQYFDRRDSLAVADPVMIPAEGQIAHCALTLVAGGRIHGRILDAMGRPPATERLRMRLHAADDSLNSIRNYSFYNCCYDEVTGDYELNQLRNGAYKLRASDKVLWTWWPHHASFAAGGTVNIESHGEVEGVDWELLY